MKSTNEEKKRIWYSNFGFLTSKHITRAYNRMDFFGLIIAGPQGIGKSTYAIKILLELYNDSWRIVRDRIFFSLDELVDFLIKLEEVNERVLCILWDDAGVHGHKYIYFRDKTYVELLSGIIDTIRTSVAGWLITTPTPSNIVIAVRESPGFRRGEVMWLNSSERLVKVYKMIETPIRKYWKKMYVDQFNIWLPDEIYNEYMEMRKNYEREAKAAYIRELKRKKEEMEEVKKSKTI